MSARRNSIVSLRSLALLGVVSLLVLPMTLLIGAPGANRILTQDETAIFSPTRVSPEELRVAEKSRVDMFSRPEASWWPITAAAGLKPYGHVPRAELSSPDTLIMPHNKGSFNTRVPGFRHDLPEALKVKGGAPGVQGGSRYFVAQLTPAAVAGKGPLQVRRELSDLGMEPIEYVPNNGFLVRIKNAQNINQFNDTKKFQFASELSLSDKIHPAVGRKQLRDQDRAVSDTLELVIQVMPGESPDDLVDAINRVGGEVVQVHPSISGLNYVSAKVLNSRLLELMESPAAKVALESPEYQEYAFTHSAVVEMGRMLDPRDIGDFVFPFRNAGIDGGGIINAGTPPPNYANPSPGAALSLSGVTFDVMPQFLGVADNGLTLDAPGFGNDNTHPCLTTNCTSGAPPFIIAGAVGPNHRKVEVYARGRDANNDNTIDDATAAGDFLTCDSVRSGGNSHGTTVASAAAGNPSLGRLGLGRLYEDLDTIDQFVTFFNDSREVNLPLDGQARGARIIFQDIAATPASSPPACAINFLSDTDPGDAPANRLADMAFRRDLMLANSTIHPRGAKVTLFAFGAPTNFDDNLTNGQGTYMGAAEGIDTFLFNNRRVAHVQAVGNDGGDPTAAVKIDPFQPTDPNDVFDAADIQINDVATAKNIITVGTVGTDSLRAASDPAETTSFFSAHGPATFDSLRGSPLVMAPGVDTGGGREGTEGRYSDDYFISEALVTSFDNTNNTDGGAAVENVLLQGRAGTSVSAGHVAGAALQVRDYLAQGFYPSGTRTAADRVSDVSGMLVKAVLMNSADFSSSGLMASCQGRGPIVCPTEQGYGKVELASTLPLSSYRLERRAPNASSIAPVSNVPINLLVADEYFDGGMRGSSATDGSTTGIGVVPVGGSVSFDVFRRDGQDQFRASLAWYDAPGEMLRNNLDLTVISGDYDLTAGGAGLCGPTGAVGVPAVCGSCTYAANDAGSGGYFDPTSNNPFVNIWRGNQFRQHGGQFSLIAQCNQPDPNFPCFGGNIGEICSDFATFPENEPDTVNPTESVMLHYFGDPAVFAAGRSGGDHGFYRVRVSFPSSVGATGAPDAPAIHAGANNILNSGASGDDVERTFANGQPYISTGPNGINNSTRTGDDIELIPNGSFGQTFGLAVAGPLYNNRVGSYIALDRFAYDCSERVLTVRVGDGSRPATSATSVRNNTRLEALDPNGTVRDTEGDLTFAVDPGAAGLRVGRANHYTSAARRLQIIQDRPGANNPISNNGILEVSDGWTIRAIYDDKTALVGGGPTPEPEDAVTTANVNCRPILGPVFLGGGTLPNGIANENVRPTVVSGGCDVGRAIAGSGDFFLDAGETVTYSMGVANQNLTVPINLKGTLSCSDPVPGGDNPCSFLTIPQPTVELGVIPAGREGIGMWTIKVDQGVLGLATADRAVDLQVTFTSRSTDFGDVLGTQVFTSREALQADMEILRYNTDFPGGGTQAADYNRDGLIRTLIPGSGARNRELATFQPLNNFGNPNGAIAANMPWRLDTNNGGFTAFRAADSKPSGAQNSLAWFYSTGGGCGWQTQNRGIVGSSATLPKGVWHAGHGPVLGFGVAGACPGYTNPTDPTTVPLTEFIQDMLQGPIFNKVNQGLDARGIPFDLRFEAMGWNETQEFADGATAVILEIDTNLDDSGPAILGNAYTYRPPFGDNGPRTSAADSQRTFGPLRDSDGSLALAKPAATGEEVGVSSPIVQRRETVFTERPLMAYPVADIDGNVRGFQSNTAIDGATGLPVIPGRCQGPPPPGSPCATSTCRAGSDVLVTANSGTGACCTLNSQCTGPGTRVGHTTPWGPVRNRELDGAGTFEDFNGASGNRFQFEFNWIVGEGGQGALGWTIDDPYFEWSEQHPADQDANSPNDCSQIGGDCVSNVCTVGDVGSACTTDADCVTRPGGNPNARQCANLAFERITLYNCTNGMRITLTDATTSATVNTQGCTGGTVPVNVRSNEEALGETFCLAPQGGGVFSGTVQMSAVANQAGVLFVGANPGENFNVVGAYSDPECDRDNDGELGEFQFRDVDGDGVLNFGADGFLRDVSLTDFLAEGQGSSDDDLCFNSATLVDVYNPAGVPQLDNNGDGVVNASDCPAVGMPNGRSPRNGQCDWDDDGFGDLCDNCPQTANNNQLDTDGDGIGNVCEDNDIDRDGRVQALDNCDTLYNPSQAPDPNAIRGAVCDSLTDFDGDLVAETNDNCPNEGGALENGVLAPPFSATYNPDQADLDNDGIGDKCDSEDFDKDGVVNLVDNCRTVYNPADPTFQIQTDSDLDGRGDDRTQIDLLPGPQSYCDPDSADDNLNGVPDDIIQVGTEVDCNHTQFGISNTASTINALGSVAIFAVRLTDDGTADFTCIAGDPDPNNNPIFPEFCTQETPGDPDNDAECDTPGFPGSGVCAALGDGSADPGELSSVRLELVNASTSRQTGAGRALTNAIVGIRPTTPSVGCVPLAQTARFYDPVADPNATVVLTTMPAGGRVSTFPGALTFIVDPASGNSTAVKLAEAEFALAVQADDLEGISTQTFKLFVDVDRTDFALAAPNCPNIPTALPGELCEDFDTNRNATAGIQFTRLATAHPGDTLRANGDPNDDVLGFTQGTSASPTGTAGRGCARSVNTAFRGCQGVVTEENDWHLHSGQTGEDPGSTYDPPNRLGIGAPDGGKAHGGLRSMHMGRHTNPASTLGDTTRFRQVAAFVLDSQGDPNIPGVVIGPASTMEFWHIVEFPDNEGVGDGFIPAGVTFGGTQVQISLRGFNGLFERWQRLTPTFNGYDSINQASISICHFDPGDDEIAPNNETMCDLAPMWAELGGSIGNDHTCTADTDNNDPAHLDCGDVKSCAIPGGGGGNCTAQGAIGPGVWARSAFVLSPFAGRTARLRWIGASGGGWSFDLNRSFLEPAPGNIAYQYFEQDDGWWIDSIKLTDVRGTPALFAPEPTLGLSVCQVGDNPINCGVITVNIAGSVAFGSRRLLGLDSFLQPIILNAKTTTAGNDPNTPATEGACDNGLLQFEWSQLDANGAVVDVLSPFSPQGAVTVAPSRDTTYRVDVRCSSDSACVASREVLVKAYTGEGSDLNLRLDPSGAYLDGLDVVHDPNTPATARLQWSARPQPPGISGYDVFKYTYIDTVPATAGVFELGTQDVFDGNTYNGTCFANAVPQAALGTLVTTNDAAAPASGTTFMYQVGHSSTNSAVAIAPLGVRPSSSNRSGQLVTATSTCP